MPRALSGTPTWATSTACECARAARCWARSAWTVAPSPACSAGARTRSCSSSASTTAGPRRRSPVGRLWRSRRPRRAPGSPDQLGTPDIGLSMRLPADADAGTPLGDQVGRSGHAYLVGPVPQAQVELDGAAGEHGVVGAGLTGGRRDRPVTDPQRPRMPGVGGTDQQRIWLGCGQAALAAGDEPAEQLVD